MWRIEFFVREAAVKAGDVAIQNGSNQVLYYSLMTGRKPGVVLIMEDEDDERFLARLNALAFKYNIRVWTVH